MQRISEIEYDDIDDRIELTGIVKDSKVSSDAFWYHLIDGKTFVSLDSIGRYVYDLVRLRITEARPTRSFGRSHGTREAKLVFPPRIEVLEVLEPLIGIDAQELRERREWKREEAKKLENERQVVRDTLLPAYRRLGDVLETWNCRETKLEVYNAFIEQAGSVAEKYRAAAEATRADFKEKNAVAAHADEELNRPWSGYLRDLKGDTIAYIRSEFDDDDDCPRRQTALDLYRKQCRGLRSIGARQRRY